MGIFEFNIPFVNSFLNNFKEQFSKRQARVFIAAVYSLLKEYNRNCLSRMAAKTNYDYEAFQYFFSDARWNSDELNTKRLKVIENQRTTASTSSGVLVIDDTANPKPHARATEGARYQHCPTLGREEVCNVAVASAFSSSSKYFPINLKFYKPQDEFKYHKYDDAFKSKNDLAKELVLDALDKKINFKSVVIDSWYTSNDFLEFLNDRGLNFVADLKPNRRVLFYHPAERRHCWIQQNELVKLVRSYYPHKLKPVTVSYPSGYERRFFSYSFMSRLKECSVKVKIILLFGDFCDEDSKSIHLLVTNDLNSYVPSIVSQYSLRWGIERIFKELKDLFYFDQYQVRHKRQIERYWMLCFVAWTLVYWVKQNGCLSRTIDKKLCSFNDYKRAIDSLLILSSTAVISKNSNYVYGLYGIKSQNIKNTVALPA
jgi:SRSO17 transposase